MRAMLLTFCVASLALLIAIKLEAKTQPEERNARRVVGHGQIRFNGLGPEKWAMRFRRERDHTRWLTARVQRLEEKLERTHNVRQLQARHLETLHVPALYAIRLASALYGVSYTQMVSVARCETGGTFSTWAYNRTSGAAGLFQWIPSSWSTQGVPGFSPHDVLANALAAARAVAHDGSFKQWTCQPQ